jgi:hypothetical protein
MFYFFLAALCIVGALVLPYAVQRNQFGDATALLRLGIRIVGAALALFLVMSTSYVNIGEYEVGMITKNYMGSSLQSGHIIATDGEMGPQARTIPPGFHLEPLLNVINHVDVQRIIEIKPGEYGLLTAKDGAPLRPDQAFGESLDSFVYTSADGAQLAGKPIAALEMLDARVFLTHGGQKGPQVSVLAPGQHRLNRYLWDVTPGKATEIKPGEVGVVKSNAWSSVNFGNLETKKPASCEPTQKRSPDGGELAVPLVPVGCIGIWDNSLTPGLYYLNTEVYHVTLVDTRIQQVEFKGGYTKRSIDLSVEADGTIKQTQRSELIAKPDKSADTAIFFKVEGWDVPQEMRILAQIPPRQAPFVVASVGGLKEVEDRVIIPSIRSVARNVAGGTVSAPLTCEEEQKREKDGSPIGPPPSCKFGEPVKDPSGRQLYKDRPTRVLDLIENRPLLESNILRIVQPEGEKAGVDIKEVRFGEPAIPPELLVSRLRQQLADQLTKTYQQEKVAQDQRIETENAKATANQQSTLVAAQIAVRASQQNKLAAQNEGEGEEARLKAIAAGQEAQANVLGKDNVIKLRQYELLVNTVAGFADKHADVVGFAIQNAGKFVPNIQVSGGGGESLSMAAALYGILGQPQPPAAK